MSRVLTQGMHMNSRHRAIEWINRRPASEPLNRRPPADVFGENVFNREMMKHYLAKEVFKALEASIEQRELLDRRLADPVANGIKAWALDRGATHYTHWFQPLTGRAAEKHDSFIEISEGEAMHKFSGTELAQQEPDASAFPSGGLRSTFEARGYTAWDCSSPAFIFETTYGKTLCIPTIFVSYRGEALDFKIPLLKSVRLLEKVSLDLCRLFEEKIDRVIPTLGLEQEYFLVDRTLHDLRPDLLMTGRTLVGAAPARGQQLDDHYFGAIPERVFAFMTELEEEAHKHGIPLKTRHNEVAPGQFECAPAFESINVALDHGLLVMDLIDRIARKHHFVALLHEKPFEGLSGSGKHSNWSLMTNAGKNLLAPGKDPQENLMFLAFFVSVIHAVNDHADLLRSTVASPGNDLRLGDKEAPPVIMSVFIGKFLSKILNDIENPPRKRKHEPEDDLLRLGINEIPELLLDNTDKNRTSPFAFTGNKFEFRAVGASANSSNAMTILNVIVADKILELTEHIEAKLRRGRPLESAVLDLLKDSISSSRGIRFEGDGYSAEWIRTAKSRGLKDIQHTPYALDALLEKKSLDLFEKHHIFSEPEITARYEILLRDYVGKRRIETDVLLEIIQTQIIPIALNYQGKLLDQLSKLAQLGLEQAGDGGQRELVHELGELLRKVNSGVQELKGTRNRVEKRGDSREVAIGYAEQVLPLAERLRKFVDELESMVPDESWPLPKYRELLFLR